ncbi:MAG: type I-B CRISPR-associated protein Cas5b [Candidatus Anstonellaceae archaeon]
MEKTILVKIFQPYAQYRNPFTFYHAQTYPLPPRSTVIGMLQCACDDWYGNREGIEKWEELKVSVHGGFENIFWNYQNLIKGEIIIQEDKFLNKTTKEGKGKDKYFPIYGEGKNSQRSPVYQQELFNGHLYIFIRGKEDIVRMIKSELEKPNKILSLGRSEDVAFIQYVKEISPIKEIQIKFDIQLTYPTYILDFNFLGKPQKYPVYWISRHIIFKNANKPIKLKREIDKNTMREVKFSRVVYTGYDYELILKENQKLNVEFYEFYEKDQKKEIRIISEYGWIDGKWRSDINP